MIITLNVFGALGRSTDGAESQCTYIQLRCVALEIIDYVLH